MIVQKEQMRSTNNFSAEEAGAIQIGLAPWKPVRYKLAQHRGMPVLYKLAQGMLNVFGPHSEFGVPDWFQSIQFP